MLIADVLTIYARDVVPQHARPKEIASKIGRLASWWGNPTAARRKTVGPVPNLAGYVNDINAANCNACVAWVGARRSASRDFEILRAALNHAHAQRVLDGVVKVTPSAKVLATRALADALRGRKNLYGRRGARAELSTVVPNKGISGVRADTSPASSSLQFTLGRGNRTC